MTDIKNAFYMPDHRNINIARINHLSSLNLNIKNKNILETGCGGKGDITSFLLKNTNKIILNDARQENIDYLKFNLDKTYVKLNNKEIETGKNLNSIVCDLNEGITDDINIDIIINYGTLYHLHNPSYSIQNLSNICKEFMILSTACNGVNNSIRFLTESSENAQSYTLLGCRPSREWVYNEFKKNFKYIYFPRTQPLHEDFKLKWPTTETCRFIIIGSHIKIDNNMLTDILPEKYENIPIFYYFNNINYPICVSKETVNKTPHTFHRNGTLWEQSSLNQFYSHIDNKKHFNIIDIGGQSGLYSLYAKFLPNSTFYTFEPFTETYELLDDNLKLNNINNVNTYNMGISDKTGDAVLNTSKNHNGLHTLGKNPLRFKDINPINIKTTTLDDFVNDKNIPIHYIKIDTEGWEYFILKGGENVIKKYRPIIQLEWNITNMKQCNVNESDLLDLLLNEYNYYERSMIEEEKLFYPFNYNINIPENISHIKIDIGLSYSAPHSQEWLSKEPNLMVIGFEPNPECVDGISKGKIEKRHPSHGEPISEYNINRFHLIPCALSNVDTLENMNFYVNSRDCGTSSLFTHDQNYLGPIEKTIKVPVISLKMFFDEFPWDKFEYIDYIKIDAQGSDLNILKGAGDYLKDRVVYVTAEPDGNQYQGANECNVQNITNYMLSKNFIKINHPNTNDPTFVNKKFKDISKDIYIYQNG